MVLTAQTQLVAVRRKNLYLFESIDDSGGRTIPEASEENEDVSVITITVLFMGKDM